MFKRGSLIVLSCIFFLLISSLTTFADASQFQIGLGERGDTLRWNIAGDLDGQNPNILSELSWNDLDSTQLALDFQHQLGTNFFGQGRLFLGLIDSGVVQDSDYLADDRTLEFSRSYSDADGSRILDWSLGIGRTLLSKAGWELAAMAGYSNERQYLRIIDGYQTIPDPDPITGLDSIYQTSWHGPWLGISLKKEWRQLRFRSGFEYHWADYYAEGDWNLRDDLAHPVSFTHRAEGSGISLRLGLDYALNTQWSIGFDYQMAEWRSESGTDRVYGDDGTTVSTRLNEVEWTTDMMIFKVSANF